MDLIVVVLAVVVLAVCVASLIAWRLRKAPNRPPAHVISVTVTGEHFVVADRRTRSSTAIPWASIRRITVITTSAGPFVDDLFYHIVHNGGEISLPSEARHMDAFVAHIRTLPGFNETAYATAIRSTRNDAFVVCLRLD